MKNTTQALRYLVLYVSVFGPQIGSEFNWWLPVVLKLIKNKNKLVSKIWPLNTIKILFYA
jgi:hypothetical protein